jgi:hypothetical protein
MIHDISMIINPSKLSTPSSPSDRCCPAQLRRHVDGIFLQGLGFFVAEKMATSFFWDKHGTTTHIPK